MTKIFNVALPVALFLSALALSACASKPKAVSVTEPAALTAEKPTVPGATPEFAVAPAVEQTAASAKPAPKPVIRKAKRIAVKHAPPKTPLPPPVIVPAPIVEQQAPAILPPETSPPVAIAPPAEKIAEAGFLERYWLWLLGLAVVIAVAFAWLWRSQEDRH